MLTFAFMHYPNLVCILFGTPFLHLFTFIMFFFKSLVNINLRRKKCSGQSRYGSYATEIHTVSYALLTSLFACLAFNTGEDLYCAYICRSELGICVALSIWSLTWNFTCENPGNRLPLSTLCAFCPYTLPLLDKRSDEVTQANVFFYCEASK